MGAIVLDASKVNSYVLPNLLKSNNVMKTAYNTGQALKKSLPGTFKYKTTLNNIVEEIYNLRKEIKNIDSMIDKKIQRAKTIETKRDSKITRLAQSASKIGAVTGALVGGAVGASTGSIIRTVAGAQVGAAVGSFVGKALVNTGAKIASNVKSLCINLWDGAKQLGKKIYDGAKKVVKKATSFVKNKALPFLKNVGNYYKEGLINIGKDIWTGLNRTVASVVNTCVSLVEGVVSFLEAAFDALVVIGGAVVSIFSGAVDIVNGIKNGNMEWTITKSLWRDNYLPLIGTNYTSKAFDKVYNWSFMQKLEESSFKPFKRDGGVVYEIGKGVGYYTGVIVATAFTGGAAGATTFVSNFAVTAAVSGVAELGKATQTNYNNVIDKQTKEYFIQEIMNANPNISVEDAEECFEYAKENNLLSNYDSVRKGYQENLDGGEILKILGSSGAQAVIEGTITGILRTDIKAIEAAGKTLGKIGSSVKWIQGLKIGKIKGVGKAGVQAGKSYIKELSTVIVDGDYDLKKASIDAASGAITEVVNANFGLKALKDRKSKSDASTSASETNSDTSTSVQNLASSDAPNQYNATGITGNVDKATEEVAEKALKKSIKESLYEGAVAVKDKHIFGSVIPERIVKDSYKNTANGVVVSPLVEAIANLAA